MNLLKVFESSVASSIALDMIDAMTRCDVNGYHDVSGAFIRNPVPFDARLAAKLKEARAQGLVKKGGERQIVDPSRIVTDQKVIVYAKVRNIIENWDGYLPPVQLVAFEDEELFIVSDGNHRTSAHILLASSGLLANVSDVRHSFFNRD